MKAASRRLSLLSTWIVALAALNACSTGAALDRFPKTRSTALDEPAQTLLGRHFADAARAHPGESGFHIIGAGVDGLVTRIELIRASQRTLDLQYFIFRGDETGLSIARELTRAADRGVRVRLLVDDGDTLPGDEQILALAGHVNVEVRVFNPFDYRGHFAPLRNLDFILHKGRLDYRMHNKLFVADNAVALIGGRNVGNQYFQLDPDSQFADDDVFAAGPIVHDLSATFDDYWNSRAAVPAPALAARADAHPPGRPPARAGSGIDYQSRIASGEPLAGLTSDGAVLTWAPARVVCDSPDKRDVKRGSLQGRLMAGAVLGEMRSAQSELIIVTPYFVPAKAEVGLLTDLRRRGVRVRVLSNSLESTPDIAAYSGYSSFRLPLLREGLELHEVRSLLDSVRGSGETRAVARYGNYALHAKLFVIDRQRAFYGSMNLDQRSYRINTEIGIVIDSPPLATETAGRFEEMVDPKAAYTLVLRDEPAGASPSIVWETEIGGRLVEFAREPARSTWQRGEGRLLSLLPIDSEL